MNVDYAITATSTGIQETHKIPNNVTRLVILADNASSVSCVVLIRQGGSNLAQSEFDDEQRFVFDVK